MASNKQRNESLEGQFAVPNLPQEVIQEILLRLPVKSLCRFRCVSKSWLSLISSPQFAKAHLDIALRSNILYSQRQRLIFSSGNLYSVEYESICNTNGRDVAVVTLDYPLKEKANGWDDVLDDSTENDLVYYKVSEDEDENPIIVKVDAKSSSKVTKLDEIWVEIFGSCNGLVCIAPEEDTLFLFNPSTGESKRIPEQSLSRSAPYGYNSYGFGYDPTTDDYKGYFFMELFIGWREIGKVKMTSYEAHGRAVAVKLDYPLKCDFYDEVKFIGSCNGLLCVASEPGILLLINPCTREAAEIPRLANRRPFSQSSLPYMYGFGYADSINDYKLVKISCKGFVFVYSLKANSWRRVGDFPYTILALDPGIQLHGAIHWVVSRSEDSPKSHIIGAFDLVEEKFWDVLPPVSIKNFYGISIFGECLCILPESDMTSHNDFWVMKSYGRSESWTKIVISISYFRMKPLGLFEKHRALLEIDGKLVMYNFKEETYQDLVIHGIPVGIEFEVEAYVESLVSPHLTLTIRTINGRDELHRNA